MGEPEFLLKDVVRRAAAELGLHVVRFNGISGGAQNRIVRADVQDGPPLLVKIYRRDQWPRLEREFGVLTVLERAGVRGVPRPLLKSDSHQYGVYSFESGRPKSASELSTEEIEEVARAAAELHSLSPEQGEDDLMPAIDAAFSLEQDVAVIDRRLGSLEAFLAGGEVYDEVRELTRELDVRARLDALVQRAIAGSGNHVPLPRAAWRINTGDFGPQNLLFGDDGNVTVLDFEAAGWDDPARLVMGFVAHAASENLSAEAAHAFLQGYADERGLTAEERERYEQVGVLLDLEWVAIYASALTPEAVSAKQYAAVTNFDRHTYLMNAIGRLKLRLVRATHGFGYRFYAG
jgi:Ser/Thr protein kinase RdoA (MazF antagonist)